jgi:hypothetical protein
MVRMSTIVLIERKLFVVDQSGGPWSAERHSRCVAIVRRARVSPTARHQDERTESRECSIQCFLAVECEVK